MPFPINVEQVCSPSYLIQYVSSADMHVLIGKDTDVSTTQVGNGSIFSDKVEVHPSTGSSGCINSNEEIVILKDYGIDPMSVQPAVYSNILSQYTCIPV